MARLNLEEDSYPVDSPGPFGDTSTPNSGASSGPFGSTKVSYAAEGGQGTNDTSDWNPYPDTPPPSGGTGAGTGDGGGGGGGGQEGGGGGGGNSNLKTAEDFQRALGSLYDTTIYQDYLRNTSNNGGGDPNDWFNRIVAKNELRGTNEVNSTYTPNLFGGTTTGPFGKVNTPQFPTTSAFTPAVKGTPIDMIPYAPSIQPWVKTVDDLYVKQLGRHVTSQDIAALQRGSGQATPSLDAITAGITGSPEYKLYRTAYFNGTGLPTSTTKPPGAQPIPVGSGATPGATSSGAPRVLTPGPFSNPGTTGPYSPGANGTYPGSLFDDPATKLAEQYALQRLGQNTNPDPLSGQSQFETFAKQLSDLLQGPVYSDDQQHAMLVSAQEQLQQQKEAEMKQKADELGARSISPSSGVYISEMNRIRDKWDKLSANNTNSVAMTGINQRQNNLTQALAVLAQLASAQDSRLNAGLPLSMVPYQLQSNAFDRLVGATNLGGTGGYTNGLMSLLQNIQQESQYNTAGQQQALAALMQAIAYAMGGA